MDEHDFFLPVHQLVEVQRHGALVLAAETIEYFMRKLHELEGTVYPFQRPRNVLLERRVALLTGHLQYVEMLAADLPVEGVGADDVLRQFGVPFKAGGLLEVQLAYVVCPQAAGEKPVRDDAVYRGVATAILRGYWPLATEHTSDSRRSGFSGRTFHPCMGESEVI